MRKSAQALDSVSERYLVRIFEVDTDRDAASETCEFGVEINAISRLVGVAFLEFVLPVVGIST